ncbi:thiol reductant ABC exporter subunit CydC [Pontibacillus yanchengensis]|uniref:Thiol reductant ABC exporter subunit CydC n=1 Tax=Pontibacillus yanchengensis TaxID=462910 RepID=A0ACC7VLG1_9BACI|nr:thiol reductant ABC exporter subunit CydC [Pontibacillus yanchengensis]MYL54985.1 thiol reductant ABC exporter subunit CydC [Pontibacillus yanchengensis]
MKDLQYVIKEIVTEKRDVILSVLFGVIAGLTAVALFAASGYLISKAALKPPFYTLSIMIAFLKLSGFMRAFGRYLERYFSHRATFTILSKLRVKFFERIEPLAPSILQRQQSGELLARVVGDIDRLQYFFLRVFYPPILLVLVFVSTILFTTFYSLSIALILLVGLLITGVVIPALFAWKQRRIESTIREKRGKLSTDVTEFLYGFRDLKIHQKLPEKLDHLQHKSSDYLREQEREGVIERLNLSLHTGVSLLISWLVIMVGAYLVSTNQLDGIFLAMLVMISLTVFENATPMAVLPGYLEDSRRAANRLQDVEGEDRSEKQENKWLLPSTKAFDIKANNISFAFPQEARSSIHSFSIHLPPGSKTAIVGPSGSGKSTLLQLLLKFHLPVNGEVLLGGNDIKHIAQEDIWAHTNVVLQENHFFYGTIRDNLMLAKSEATDEEMNAALQHMHLDHFSLDQKVLEKGENLSGGEKQRLAIARTFLKQASVWLLDEPTSSVDVVTEQSIFQHILRLAEQDTLLLISHRLNGLEQMDYIIVMDQGEIVEEGTYQELVAQEGYFYEMKQIEDSVLMQ